MLISLQANATTFDKYYPNETPPEKPIILRSGTIIRVLNLRGISTFANDIGDECEFINVTDMFVDEYLVFPKDTRLYGVVEDIREPVQGNDGAIKIKINKIVTPNGELYYSRTYYVDAYISNGGDNYIGGGQTKPAYYRTVAHYNEGWDPILQLQPLNIYGFGKHTVLKTGEEYFVILQKDLKIN
jgi:hypothetical protein